MKEERKEGMTERNQFPPAPQENRPFNEQHRHAFLSVHKGRKVVRVSAPGDPLFDAIHDPKLAVRSFDSP
jgi:hypothetical protein